MKEYVVLKKNIVALLALTMLTSSLVGCQKPTALANETNAKDEVNIIEDASAGLVSVPEEFKEIVEYLKNIAGVKVPYFGGYDLNDQQIIVFNMDGEKALLWKGKDGSVSMIDTSGIPEEKRMSSFADGVFKGVKTTFVMQENNPLQAFVLAIHEGYHFYGQDWVNTVPVEAYIPRGTVFNENIEARVLMNHADQSLRALMNGENPDGLGQAAYYINLIKKNHNQDLQGNLMTGLSEGSANFIENLYVAVAKNPDIKGNQQLMAKLAYEENKVNLSGEFHDKSSEYYQVSSLPMYYLAGEGKLDLLNKLQDGLHPLELLNHVTKELLSEPDRDLSEKVKTFYSESNEKAAQFISKVKEQSKSDAYVKVMIGTEAFPGSMEFGAFINYEDDGIYKTSNTMTRSQAMLNQGTFEFMGQDTLNSDDYMHYIFYVKKSDIQEGDTLKIDSENVKADGVAYSVEDAVYVIR